jgi:hypothetical protein
MPIENPSAALINKVKKLSTIPEIAYKEVDLSDPIKYESTKYGKEYKINAVTHSG